MPERTILEQMGHRSLPVMHRFVRTGAAVQTKVGLSCPMTVMHATLWPCLDGPYTRKGTPTRAPLSKVN